MKRYSVFVEETKRYRVEVCAESKKEAEFLAEVRDEKPYYVKTSKKVEDDLPVKELSFAEMTNLFVKVNKEGKPHINGYIVFAQESFDKEYSELSRTYSVSSDNKAFRPSAGGFSIFGSCMDGTDQNIRLDGYIRGPGNKWKIEKCYICQQDFATTE